MSNKDYESNLGNQLLDHVETLSRKVHNIDYKISLKKRMEQILDEPEYPVSLDDLGIYKINTRELVTVLSDSIQTDIQQMIRLYNRTSDLAQEAGLHLISLEDKKDGC